MKAVVGSLALVLLVAVAACGQSRGEGVVDSGAGPEGIAAVASPVLPVVDDAGTAWLLAPVAAERGTYRLTAQDADGWSAHVEIETGGAADGEPTLATAPDGLGVLTVATRCTDAGCDRSELVVDRYARSDDSIEPTGKRWITARDERSTGAAPRAIATRAGIALVQDSFTLLQFHDEGDPIEATMPDAAGDPCVTSDGSILAIEVHTSGAADRSDTTSVTSVTPDDAVPDGVTMSLLRLERGDWSTVPGSERPWSEVYRVGSAFSCGATGPQYAAHGQTASLSWDDGWIVRSVAAPDWELTARSTSGGVLGIQASSLVLVDPASSSAEPISKIALPGSVEKKLMEATEGSATADKGPMGGWLAIGGPNLGTGLVCLDVGAEPGFVCDVFS